MAQKRKILIADDELFFREVLKEAFQDHYEIVEAKNGEEAVSVAVEQKPDLIILDIEMPVMNGLDACRALKDRAETRRIPIVMFTSFIRKDDIVRGLNAGADDYITKPICLSEIAARVDAHLRTKDYYFDLEHKDLLFLLKLSENISAIRNPRMILSLIVEKMSDIVGVSRCSIDSVNDAGGLVVKASNDLEGQEDILLNIDRYPEIAKTLETKQPTVVTDIKNDPLMGPVYEHVAGLDYNSIVLVPIIKKERVLGTFVLRTTAQNKDGITPRIYKLCQLVANISASALENAILFESLRAAQEYFEEISIRDALTKLYNYRHFYNRLEEEFSRAVRYNAPLSMVFFDVDNFKRINDIYGHAQGDKVLRKIGEIMKTIARESDVPARYGGGGDYSTEYNSRRSIRCCRSALFGYSGSCFRRD